MIHLGDITKISGYDVPIVDCIIGGSPCQDLSIAGNRKGLDGERSGLFVEQIRIIKEMREASERTTGIPRPRFAVWENVHGALSSSKGEDFRLVLEEFCKIADKTAAIPRPPKGKWKRSGTIMGDGWSIAWRVLDAQFWGVPQRRRRIALIADFGGYAAPEILFERKSLFGNSATGGAERETTPSGVERGVGSTDMYIFKGGNGAKAGLSLSQCTAPTLTSAGSGTNQAPTICIQGNCIDRADTAGCNGKGWRYDQCYTLNTIDRPAVLAFDTTQITSPKNHSHPHYDDPCHTLTTRGRSHVVTTMQMQAFGQYKQSDIASTIKAHDKKDSTDLVVGLDSDHMRDRNVRRLTPLECERLQGFPDGWTDIGDWTDSRGRVRTISDSARYKALSNSIALPPWKWVLKRLCACYERDATMASLFDGIGGFPLIWEQLNGRGSCLWASEIEEFPIAVTRLRFGGANG